MADRNSIITLPHENLRRPSKRVGVISDEINQLVDEMTAATLDWEDHRQHEFGVALAAVQINKMQRVIIVRNDFDNKDDRSFVAFINPEIVKKVGEPETEFEGCLSVKDMYGKVPRYPKVKIKALGLSGKEIRLTAEGFLARVLQHEIDHIKGKLFIDHIKDEDSFFKLAADGKLEKIEHDQVKASDILW